MEPLMRPGKTGKKSSAFTIIELVMATVVIAVLFGVAVIHGPRRIEAARQLALQQNLSTLRNAINDFHGDHGRYPFGLTELITEGPGGYRYLTSVPTDPVTGKKDWILVVRSEITLYEEDFSDFNPGDTMDDYDGGFVPPEFSSDTAEHGIITDIDYLTGSRSLLVHGNRWCRLDTASVELTEKTSLALWMKVETLSEINAFGVADDLGREYLYQLAGTQKADTIGNTATAWFSTSRRVPDNSPQNFGWRQFILHIGSDWNNRYGYNPNIEKLYFICDDDAHENGTMYIDSIRFYYTEEHYAPFDEWTDGIVDIISASEEAEGG